MRGVTVEVLCQVRHPADAVLLERAGRHALGLGPVGTTGARRQHDGDGPGQRRGADEPGDDRAALQHGASGVQPVARTGFMLHG
ncbi:hypothetical protein Cus16_0006 [Curtobacterium sp. ER1/6]|nr:hypothetical protein Cus16_0006 [Curtobacterium sp. ER1/6]